MKVFLSVGSPATPKQDEYIKSVEVFLRANGLEPQTVGRTYFTSRQPLLAIDELMRQCQGTLVLALERSAAPEMVDRRGGPRESIQKDVKLPTVWNQIEAAMAFSYGHRLLVLVEDGIRLEGLFEERFDWLIFHIDLDKPLLASEPFMQIFAHWKQELVKLANSGKEVPNAVGAQLAIAGVRENLISLFNASELKTLCSDLGVDYESLEGSDKNSKVRELIDYSRRHGLLTKLIHLSREARPSADWP